MRTSFCSRFLINLSSEEKDPIKLCTYIELAHWYYLDLMRPEDPFLPACSLKEFMRACKYPCLGGGVYFLGGLCTMCGDMATMGTIMNSMFVRH